LSNLFPRITCQGSARVSLAETSLKQGCDAGYRKIRKDLYSLFLKQQNCSSFLKEAKLLFTFERSKMALFQEAKLRIIYERSKISIDFLKKQNCSFF
jgi:hypothetical protein